MSDQQNLITMGQVDIDPSVIISPFVIVGYDGDPTETKEHHKHGVTVIKSNVWIGPFVTIYRGARIEADVKIDPYCRIGHKTTIGKGSRILYGTRIHDDVVIGNNSIISGNCSNRVHIGNNVVHFGRIAHKFNDPHANWANTEEPSLSIGDDSIIGAQALLVGDIRIGKAVYISAGEVVRKSVPDCCIVYEGKTYHHYEWKGSLAITDFWQNCKE